MLSLTGCFWWEKPIKKDQLNYLKGKDISYVIKGFNRTADTIEDWGGYKRYTWRVCKYTGHSAIATRNQDASYYTPEMLCCNAQFDVDWRSQVVSYNNDEINFCPIDLGFKK